MTEQDTFDELKYKIVRSDAGVFYYNNLGQLHRDNDLPAIILANGRQHWFVNGRLIK